MEFQVQPPINSLTPFFSIWIQPRRTIRAIVDTDPGKYVLRLAMLSGINQTLSNLSTSDAGDTMSLPVILVIALLLGPIGGIVSIYLGGFILWFTGNMLGGRATMEQVRAAIVWSTVPILVSLPLWVPQLLLVGEELFKSSTPELESNLFLAILMLFIGLAQLSLSLWSVVLLAKTLGEVNGFSAWKGFASTLLPVLVIFVVVFCAVVSLGML